MKTNEIVFNNLNLDDCEFNDKVLNIEASIGAPSDFQVPIKKEDHLIRLSWKIGTYRCDLKEKYGHSIVATTFAHFQSYMESLLPLWENPDNMLFGYLGGEIPEPKEVLIGIDVVKFEDEYDFKYSTKSWKSCNWKFRFDQKLIDSLYNHVNKE